MQEIKISNIKFSSYLKLHIISGISFGIILSIIVLILSFISGNNVEAYFFQFRFTGILAGLMGLWIAPLTTITMLFINALISYPGFKLFMKLKKDFSIKIKVKE